MSAALWDINRFLGRWPTSDLVYHDLNGLVADLDRLGIGRAAVCHTAAWQYDPTLGNAMLSDALADASPAVRDRLLPCWAVVPYATGEQGSPAELAAAMDRHGVRVARLFPRDHNYSLSGPDAAAMLGFLAGRETVTLVDLDQTSWEEIDRIAGDHPDLPLVVCRVGYRGLRRMAGVLERRGNVRVDLSYFGSHEGVEWIVERFGAGRLLFGTGAPLADGGGAVTRLMLAGVSAEDREEIGQGNLSRLLGNADGPLPPPAPLPPAAAGGRGENAPAAQVRRGEPIRDWDVVDAHAHIGRWYNFFTPATDSDAMVAVMDRCGVRKAVVSGLLGVGPDATGGNVEVVDLVSRHPDRFAGYALLNPHHPDSPADVERTLDVPGIVGVKIHPETHAYPVTGSGYDAAWEIAARRGVPVLTHTEGGSPYCDPAMFRAVAERWPQVRIILGHAGVTEAGHRAAIAVARDHPNLILELCGSLTTGQWIRRLVEAVGPDRVLFGSDFPFIDLRYGLGRVVFAGLSPDESRKVLGGNARRLLKI